MEILELEEGAKVITEEERDLGRVDQFIVDPSTSEVTHVVVRKGALFMEDRVLPVEMIDHVEDSTVVVSAMVDPTDLPEFAVNDYVKVDERTRSKLDARLGAASLWRFPVLPTGTFPPYPTYPVSARPMSVPKEQKPRPRRAGEAPAVIDEQTPVFSMEGEDLGSVSELHIDEDGSLSHLVVDLRLVSGERVLPAHWIESVRRDRVQLAVGEALLERLEERPGD